MDPAVITAMAKWPNVPDCHGWLGLDRRGVWRLQGKAVHHAGLADFIGRNYQRDGSGAWYMQNGPQRVWVELAVTPWIFHLDGSRQLLTHTGQPAGTVSTAWLVDGEQLCLQTELGLGLIDDRDLAVFAEGLAEQVAAVEAVETAEAVDGPVSILAWQGVRIPLHHCNEDDLPAIGAFKRSPQASGRS